MKSISLLIALYLGLLYNCSFGQVKENIFGVYLINGYNTGHCNLHFSIPAYLIDSVNGYIYKDIIVPKDIRASKDVTTIFWYKPDRKGADQLLVNSNGIIYINYNYTSLPTIISWEIYIDSLQFSQIKSHLAHKNSKGFLDLSVFYKDSAQVIYVHDESFIEKIYKITQLYGPYIDTQGVENGMEKKGIEEFFLLLNLSFDGINLQIKPEINISHAW